MIGALLAAAAIVISLLRWGGYVLIASDSLPPHVDAAVVLQGSIAGEIARIAGAMRLLQQGGVGRVLLSVPQQSYWGEPIAPMARRYLERNYGEELASRVDFCQTGPDVNSTEDEAHTLGRCIQQHGWQDVAIVTSDYHTRRAGMLWRKILPKEDPTAHLWVYGVSDPEFEAHGWWRTRLYAKTWFMESLKLIWATLFG
ncbi:MAG: YdcF family protein [Candidatus Sulfotelmatobacter sp.]